MVAGTEDFGGKNALITLKRWALMESDSAVDGRSSPSADAGWAGVTRGRASRGIGAEALDEGVTVVAAVVESAPFSNGKSGYDRNIGYGALARKAAALTLPSGSSESVSITIAFAFPAGARGTGASMSTSTSAVWRAWRTGASMSTCSTWRAGAW